MTAQVGGSAIPVHHTNVEDLNSYQTNAKNAIAMVADSLKSADISFVEHRAYQYDNRNPSRPSISHPLHSVRIGVEKYEVSDEPWQEKYGDLLDNYLPKDIKQWIESQTKLSFNVRDPNFYVFNSLLVMTAKALVFADRAAMTKPPDSAEFQRAQENLLVPFVATQAAIAQGRETLKEVMAGWQEIGRNDPNFDKNRDYLNQTAGALKSLESTIIALAQDPPVKGSFEKLKAISLQIETLKQHYHATTAGNNLRILGSTIDTLSMVVSSLLLGYGPASALWMLTLGTPAKSEGSPMQNAVSRLTDGLTTGLDAGKKALLSASLQTILMVVSATASGIADKGLSYLPQSTGNKLNIMSLDLTTALLFHSQIFQNIAHALGAIMTQNPKSQALIENSTMLAVLATVLMSVENRPGFSASLFDTLNQDIGKAIDKVDADLETKNDPQLNGVKIYLQQAKIALENQSFSGFKEAYEGLLKTLNISSGELNGEFKEINQLGNNLMQAFTTGPEESSTTIQAA